MNKEQYDSLLRFLCEERAHLKFGDDAIELNTHTGEFNFTYHADKFIRSEISVLEMTFEQFGYKHNTTLLYKIKSLLRIID